MGLEYLPTFTIDFSHSCRSIFHSHSAHISTSFPRSVGHKILTSGWSSTEVSTADAAVRHSQRNWSTCLAHRPVLVRVSSPWGDVMNPKEEGYDFDFSYPLWSPSLSQNHPHSIRPTIFLERVDPFKFCCCLSGCFMMFLYTSQSFHAWFLTHQEPGFTMEAALEPPKHFWNSLWHCLNLAGSTWKT